MAVGMMMGERTHKILEIVSHWMIAGVIAAIIAWLFIDSHISDRKPCAQRVCFAQLDGRLSAIEAEMKVRTEDRYRGSDAKRDKLAMQAEINALRAEINKRIDAIALHKSRSAQ